MFVTLTFPNIGPELFHIDAFQLFGLTLGPFALRWYALAYIVGLLLGWRGTCAGSVGNTIAQGTSVGRP